MRGHACSATPADSQHAIVAGAIRKLRSSGNGLHVCSQSLIEFRAAATRPASLNGLGVTSADATAEIARFLLAFPILPDNHTVFTMWRTLTDNAATLGKQNHDARMMAAATVHGCTHILTFNDTDFIRYASLSKVRAVKPTDV